MSDIARYTEREIFGDCSREESSYLDSESANSTESLKTARQGGFFVSGETIHQIMRLDPDLNDQNSSKNIAF
jgi:hypothetical protein